MSDRFSAAWLDEHRVVLSESVHETDIVGIAHVMDEVKSVLARLANQELMASIGAEMPRGMLFWGAPGTGKTLVARFVASSLGADVPMYELSADELTPNRIRGLTRHLAATGLRCLVYLDEIDLIAVQRGWGGHDSGTRATLVAFLAALDGLRQATGPIFVAASNQPPSALDGALMRPGRIGFHVHFDFPDAEERAALLRLFLGRRPVEGGIDIDALAELSASMSPAAIRAAVDDATAMALADARSQTSEADLRKAIMRDGRIEPEPEPAEPPQPDRLARCAIHEAGHVAVAVSLRGAEWVRSVKISDLGGHSQIGYADDASGIDAAEMRDQIIVGYGGIAAEEQLLGAATLGVASDISRVTSLAARLGESGLLPGSRPISSESLSEQSLAVPLDASLIVLAELAGAHALARRMVETNAKGVRHLAGALFRAPEGALDGAALVAAIAKAGLTLGRSPGSNVLRPSELLAAASKSNGQHADAAAPVQAPAVEQPVGATNGSSS